MPWAKEQKIIELTEDTQNPPQAGSVSEQGVNTVMIFGILTLLVSLVIAGIAAWFSIVGLMAVFSASAFSVAIMASALELGKLVSASWLYRNWNTAPLGLKSYLTGAVLVLMLITSTGIFGFLSKAHLDQNLSADQSQNEITRIQQRIDTRQQRIASAETQLTAMDTAIQNWIDGGYMSRAMDAQTEQAELRQNLQNIILANQNEISDLRDSLMPLQESVNSVEAKLGPIKYVSELVYGEDDPETTDRALQYFILLLVLVFDPLAVLLLIAANRTLMSHGVHLEQPAPIPAVSGDEATTPEPQLEIQQPDDIEHLDEFDHHTVSQENDHTGSAKSLELATALEQLPQSELDRLFAALNSSEHSAQKKDHQ